MDDVPYTDFASSIRYSLLPRSVEDERVDIVLDLFRGSALALSRTIARVDQCDAGSVLTRCRRHLDRLGAHAVSNLIYVVRGGDLTPVPALDWEYDVV